MAARLEDLSLLTVSASDAIPLTRDKVQPFNVDSDDSLHDPFRDMIVSLVRGATE